MKGWDVVEFMKEQAKEPIDTLYMPDTKSEVSELSKVSGGRRLIADSS
jgi:hypothetical protein